VGRITFEEWAGAFSHATVVVRLVDTTYADAPAEVVAEYVRRDVDFDPRNETGLPFELDGPEPNPRAHYTVEAHIDLDGDGTVSRGDLLTMQSYPVLTFGCARDVNILVEQVR
jgi:uncharacterized lipoprotein YbaY